MTSDGIISWFEASKKWFEEMAGAQEVLLTQIGRDNRTGFEVAATRLLHIISEGEALPPLPDPEAQRHFAAGLARYKDAAETLVRTEDEAELLRAIRAIDASNAEFARMAKSL
jgi:hypothetical protein